MNTSGQDPESTPSRRHRRHCRRRHDRHGDVRDRVRGPAPHRAAARRPHHADARTDFNGQPMTDIDFGSFFVQLVTAGNDTTKTMLVVGAARAARPPRPARRAARRSDADPGRGRGDPALREPAALLPAHGDRRHRAARRRRSRPATRSLMYLHVGQPRRGRVRRPAPLRHPPRRRTRTCRSASPSTSASACTWPGSKAACSSRSCSRPSRRSS